MIDRRVVDKYLNQPCENHNWVKEQEREFFLKRLHGAKLDGSYLHQVACTYLGVKYGQFAFFF